MFSFKRKSGAETEDSSVSARKILIYRAIFDNNDVIRGTSVITPFQKLIRSLLVNDENCENAYTTAKILQNLDSVAMIEHELVTFEDVVKKLLLLDDASTQRLTDHFVALTLLTEQSFLTKPGDYVPLYPHLPIIYNPIPMRTTNSVVVMGMDNKTIYKNIDSKNVDVGTKLARELSLVEKRPTNLQRLHEFESLCFENRIFHLYTKDIKFADYIYYNLLFYLNANNYDEIDMVRDSWQKKMLELLSSCDFSDKLAVRAFYDSSVTCNGTEYDTSFVPKYPVLELRPINDKSSSSSSNSGGDSDDTKTQDDKLRQIEYWEKFDPSETDLRDVDFDKYPIFQTFPIKAGYIINRNGIVYIGSPQITKKNRAAFRFEDFQAQIIGIKNLTLCSKSDIDANLDGLARQLDYSTALNYVLHHTSTIIDAALGMLVLGRLVESNQRDGKVLVSFENIASSLSNRAIIIYDDNSHPIARIAIPNEHEILSWIQSSTCDKDSPRLAMARVVPEEWNASLAQLADKFVTLCKSIERAANSQLDCSFLASKYRCPPAIWPYVATRLTKATEYYIFYTIILQDYPNYAIAKLLNEVSQELVFEERQFKQLDSNLLAIYEFRLLDMGNLEINNDDNSDIYEISNIFKRRARESAPLNSQFQYYDSDGYGNNQEFDKLGIYYPIIQQPTALRANNIENYDNKTSYCLPDNCMDEYVFTDPQLNIASHLDSEEDIWRSMSLLQKANFISSELRHHG